MNTFVQNIFAFSALILAIGFMARKFIWKKPKSKKAFNDHHDCDNCH